MKQLTLYSRTGCCLCEGLESRLRDLDLLGLSIELAVIDIDAPGTPQELRRATTLRCLCFRLMVLSFPGFPRGSWVRDC